MKRQFPGSKWIAVVVAIIFLMGCGGRSEVEDHHVENAENIVSTESVDHKAIGDSIVGLTFDTLKKSLMSKMKAEGPIAAIDYCRSYADVLTTVHQEGSIESITRTAVRLRNKGNAPDSLEQRILSEYESGWSDENLRTSRVISVGNKVHYFKPIKVLKPCLSCHGDQVNHEVLVHIRTKYPADSAIGFKEGDLRGMWHVVFK